MMNKVRSTILVGVALAVTALMLMPSAVAQSTSPPQVDYSITPPSAAIKPEIESGSLRVNGEYKTGNAAQPLGGLQNQNVVITLTPACPNGIVMTGASQKFVTVQPQSQTATFEATFQVTVPRTAPGLQSVQCSMKVKASALAEGVVAAVPDQEQKFAVNVDYYSLNQVKVASKLKQSGPQKQVPFEMEITNFGNARTAYVFEVTSKPGGSWNDLPPEVLLLDSPNSGQGSNVNTAIFTVATPFKNGWNNLEGAYTVTIKPSAADNPEKSGTPLTANMLVRVRGVYVPSIEPILMLGAMMGSALLLRLRKDDE
jgi:hypothetical protein